MLRQGMIERFRKATPIIREFVDDLVWIQNEFNPEKATEEERKGLQNMIVEMQWYSKVKLKDDLTGQVIDTLAAAASWQCRGVIFSFFKIMESD